MVHRLSFRVSWICLLLFSSGACFPATDYRSLYAAALTSGPAPGSNSQSESSRPLVSLQQEQASAPTGNWSPSRLGALSVAAGFSPSYEPNQFIMTSESSPPQNAGYVSPPVGPPAGTGKTVPGSDWEAYIPVYEASPFPPPGFEYPAKIAGNMATTMEHGKEPVPYIAAPVAYDFEGPSPYENPSSTGSHPWAEQLVGQADSSFYDPSNWMLSYFPDFSVWDSYGVPQSVSETSPLPPSSYIIQSTNGYQREREVLSHTRYSPEDLEPPGFPFQAVKAPSWPSPVIGTKGGKKVL